MSARIDKRVVVVVGMHRSGTSAITRGLQCLGVELGNSLLPPVPGDNDKGYWEDADIHRLNDDLLAHLGRDWSSLVAIGTEDWTRQDLAPFRLRAVDLMRAKTASTAVFGLKNPRIALLLPFWKSVFEHVGLAASYVIAVRNPLSVARSMIANKRRGDIPLEKAHYLWLSHIVASVLGTEDGPRVFVDYDRLLERPAEELQRIARSLHLQRTPTDLETYEREFLDVELRHSRFQFDDLKLAVELPREAVGAFRMLSRLARDKVSASSTGVHDFFTSLQGRLADMQPAFACLADREAKIAELNAQIASRDGQIGLLNQGVADRDARIHALNQGLSERDGQIIRLSQAVNDRDLQIAAHVKGAEKQNAVIITLNRARVELEAGVARLNELLAERDVQINLLNQAIVEPDGRSIGLNEGQAERDRQIVSLTQAVGDRDAQLAAVNKLSNDRAAHIHTIEIALAERDGQIARLSQTLSERDALLAELNRAASDRAAHIHSLELALAQREGQISRLAQALEERETRLATLNQSLAARDREAAKLSGLVSQRDGQIAAIAGTLAEKETQNATLHQGMGDRNARIVWLSHEIADQKARIAELGETILQQSAQAESLRQVISDRDSHIRNLGVDMSHLHAHIADLRSVNAALQARATQYDALLRSKTWRLTEPIRVVLDGVLRAGSAVRGLGSVFSVRAPSMQAQAAAGIVQAPPPEVPPPEPLAPAAAEPAPPPAAPAIAPVPALEETRRSLLEDARRRFAGYPGGETIPVDDADPTISVLMPVYKVPIALLRAAAESVIGQTYQKWELCIVDDCSASEPIRAELDRLAALDDRIKVNFLARNAGISGASNQALDMATGTFVALLDNDDALTVDALACVAEEIRKRPDVDVLYSDECKLDESGMPTEVFAKPDWSPMLLLNCMYMGHLTTYRRALVEQVGGFRSAFDFSQDYDLALRVTERTQRIVHIERILYGWRMIASSAAAGGKPEARRSNIAALQDAVDRRGWAGTAVPLPTANRVAFDTSEYDNRVSLIVPSDSKANILQTVESIVTRSSYANYEIVVVTNSRIIGELRDADLDPRVRLCAYDKPYSFSDKCNVGVAASDGEFVVFFNDDVRVISPDWIQGLLEYLRLDGVGIVGPKLLYENGLIQHAGMLTGVRTLVGTAFHCLPANTTVHYNFAQSVREVSLICGACLGTRRTLFDEIGGFDTVNVPISHSDVDLCFKVREKGLSCVYTPHAELVHIGHMSLREVDSSKEAEKPKRDKVDIFLLRRWADFVARDPYFTSTMRGMLYRDSPESFEIFAPPATHAAKGGKDVLLVSHDLSESGAPRVLFDIAKAMAAEGHFVAVVSPFDGPMRTQLQSCGFPVIVDSHLLTGNESFGKLARNFDIVLCNTAVTWREVAQLRDHPNSYWYMHEGELLTHFIGLYPEMENVIRTANRVLVGSERVREILSKYRLDAAVLEYGVEVPPGELSKAAMRKVSTPTGQRGPRKIICGIFASYEPRKGQDLLIAAGHELPPHLAARVEFRFYGRVLAPHFFDDIKRMAAPLRNVALNLEIPLEEYFQRMAECDLIVIPSRDDTLPLVSLHALALGKPLMCTLSTGTSKYLAHMKTGILVAANTSSAMAQALFDALSMDEVSWRDIGKAGRKVFDDRFRPERFRRRIVQILGESDVPAQLERVGSH